MAPDLLLKTLLTTQPREARQTLIHAQANGDLTALLAYIQATPSVKVQLSHSRTLMHIIAHIHAKTAS